ncbi:TOG array regulator of axonemal microtubules protein 1-like [Ornithodoros turicata]|uniref:TOG array regulator of axonemal microtubules protein 1-like n=1 Tax=Ornithodoros turicata TaxID=34597 RepID=UPI003138B5DF
MAADPLFPEGLPTLELPLQRRDTLSDLRSNVRRQGMQLALVRGGRPYFEDLVSRSLDDQDWEVRLEAALFIREAVPLLPPEDLESCVVPALPGLIRNLGHEVMTLRRACLHALQVYLSLTKSSRTFLELFVKEGLRNDRHLVRRGCVVSVKSLFAGSRGGISAEHDTFPVFEALVDLLLSELYSSSYPVLAAIEAIRQISGAVTFSAYVERLNPVLRKVYHNVLENYNGGAAAATPVARSGASNSWNSAADSTEVSRMSYEVHKTTGREATLPTERLHCGIMGFRTAKGLRNEDWRVRAASAEHVKCLLKDTENVASLLPHIDTFVDLLIKLLDDCHPKVVSLALDVLGTLAERLEPRIVRTCLRILVNAACKRLGDTKIVIREQCATVLHCLMRRAGPCPVLSLLLDRRYQGSRNPRLREEIVNRVTAAVLTFPSSELDLGTLCRTLSPCLVDPKRRVRLAAMECFAALSQTLGPNRLHLVVAAVDNAELNYDGGEGLWAALQTRLSRRTLPSCSPNGMVTYALSLPLSGAVAKRSGSPSGLDVDWVVAASGSTSSATPPSSRRSRQEQTPAEVLSSRRGSRPRTGYLVSMARPRTQRQGAVRQCSIRSSRSRDSPVRASPEANGWNHGGGCGDFVNGKSGSPESSELARVDSDFADVEHNYANGKDPVVIRRSARLPNGTRTSTTSTETTVLTDHSDPPPESIPSTKSSSGREEDTPTPTKSLRRRTSLKSIRRASKELPWATSSTEDDALASEEAGGDPDNDDVELDITEGLAKEPIHTSRSGSRPPFLSPEALFGGKPVLARTPLGPQAWSPSSDPTSPTTMGNGSVMRRSADSNSVMVSPRTAAETSPRLVGVSDNVWNHSVLANLENVSNWKNSQVSPSSGGWSKGTSAPPEESLDSTPQEPVNFSISKITMDKLLQRKQEVLREVEQKRLEELAQKQQQQQQLDEHQSAEKPNTPAGNSNDSVDVETTLPAQHDGEEDVTVEESSQSRAGAESSGVLLSRIRPRSRSTSLKARRSRRKTGTLQIKPATSQPNLQNPTLRTADVIRQALRSFSSDSWKTKVEAMQTLQQKAAQDPDAFTPPLLKATLRTLTEEVRNLRSSVARAAIGVLGDFFQHLRKNMEPELEGVTQALLHKSGENAGFIRDDIDHALRMMIEHITPAKALLALIEGGASHRNGAVRRTTAQCVLACVEKLGPSRCLQGNRELTEKLLPAAALFVMDATPLTRYYGRKIFHPLLGHSDFTRQFERCVALTTRRNVATILEGILRKGVGEMPKESLTASRRGHASKATVFP